MLKFVYKGHEVLSFHIGLYLQRNLWKVSKKLTAFLLFARYSILVSGGQVWEDCHCVYSFYF